MPGVTPTTRTLAECRKRGWMAQTVEKFNHHTKRRIDVFGFGDVLVVDDVPGSLLVQATSTPNMGSRVRKICTECGPAARRWLERGNRIEVWGWAKRGKAGKRKLWTLRKVEITIAMIDEMQLEQQAEEIFPDHTVKAVDPPPWVPMMAVGEARALLEAIYGEEE